MILSMLLYETKRHYHRAPRFLSNWLFVLHRVTACVALPFYVCVCERIFLFEWEKRWWLWAEATNFSKLLAVFTRWRHCNVETFKLYIFNFSNLMYFCLNKINIFAVWTYVEGIQYMSIKNDKYLIYYHLVN